jgi:hypothetical protein
MEKATDAHIFGHAFSVPVTCKVRYQLAINTAGEPNAEMAWNVFDVSQNLPDGLYAIDAGGLGEPASENWTGR